MRLPYQSVWRFGNGAPFHKIKHEGLDEEITSTFKPAFYYDEVCL